MEAVQLAKVRGDILEGSRFGFQIVEISLVDMDNGFHNIDNGGCQTSAIGSVVRYPKEQDAFGCLKDWSVLFLDLGKT